MPTAKDADPETVLVKITGQGIELERRIPLGTLPRLMSFLLAGEGAAQPPTSQRHTPLPPSQAPAIPVGAMERPMGAVEYLREKRPQTSSDTILVLAGYLEIYEARRPFSRQDIRRMIRAARLPEPANLPRDVGVAVAKGYIQPLADGFQLTNTGLDLVGQGGPLLTPRNRGGAGKRGGRHRTEPEPG